MQTIQTIETLQPEILEKQEVTSSRSIAVALALFIPILFNEELAYLVTGNKSDVISLLDIPIAVLYVMLYMRYNNHSFSSIGLKRPESWRKTIRNGILLAVGIQIIAAIFVTILTIAIGGPDYSTFNPVKGNSSVLLYWLMISWTTAGFGEEFVMRGFMITYLIILLSRYLPEKYAERSAVILSSVTFGLLHTYQGIFGVITTGFVGFVLAVIFLRSKRNLWLVIVIHGTMDTLGFVALFFL